MYVIHLITTWLHIVSAIYWIGAIFFILTALGPVLRKQPSIVVPPIIAGVHERVRKFVLIAIVIFVITGIFNMYYRGLFDMTSLLETSYGRVFLLKMVPVSIMFALYFSGPALMEKFSSQKDKENCSEESACCEMEEGHSLRNRVFASLHVVALLSGFMAVFLGALLRG